MQRGLHHDVHRTVVDRHTTVELGGDRTDQVGIGVRGSGDLPEPELVGVGLTGGDRVQDAHHVTLGLYVEHRRGLIGAEDRRRARDRAGNVGRCVPGHEREPDGTAAVDEEAVERACQRLYAVVVSDESERRLRLARRENSLRWDAARHRDSVDAVSTRGCDWAA